jgi:hypothetical protein
VLDLASAVQSGQNGQFSPLHGLRVGIIVRPLAPDALPNSGD